MDFIYCCVYKVEILLIVVPLYLFEARILMDLMELNYSQLESCNIWGQFILLALRLKASKLQLDLCCTGKAWTEAHFESVRFIWTDNYRTFDFSHTYLNEVSTAPQSVWRLRRLGYPLATYTVSTKWVPNVMGVKFIYITHDMAGNIDQ